MAPKKKEKDEDVVPTVDEEAPILFERTEQEEKCEAIYAELKKLFKKLEKQTKPDKMHAMIKDITNKLKEAKALIKDFEREARADGMAPKQLAERKKVLASELNGFIQMKKDFAQGEGNKLDLFTGAQNGEVEMGLEGMSMQTMMTKGRKDISDIDKTLERTERLVEDTKDVGRNVAGTLHDQTKKLEKIVDDLNEIEFNMKKATKVIRDITRGMLTDKCIAFLLLLVVVGVVVIIVLKIIKPNKDKVTQGVVGFVNNTGLAGAVDSALNATTGAISSGVNSAVGSANNALAGATGRRHILQDSRKMLFDLLVQVAMDEDF